jgi:potassium efflux system protein
MNPRSTPARPGLVLALAAVFIFLPIILGEVGAQKPVEPQNPAAPTPVAAEAIPVVEVPIQSTWVANFLRELETESLLNNPKVKKIQEQLAEVRKQISLDFAATLNMLEQQPTLEALQTQQELWQRRRVQTSAWLSLLTTRATHLRDMLDYLATLQKAWSTTRDATETANAPGPILEEIRTTLADIEAAQPQLQAQHARVLDLQSTVAKEVALCGSALTRISQGQQGVVGGILTRDGLPIWSVSLWNSVLAVPDRVRGTAAAFLLDLRLYVYQDSTEMYVQIGLFAVLAALFYTVRRKVAKGSESGEGKSTYTAVFDRPYAAALLVPLLIASGPKWQAPSMLKHMFNVLSLVPMIRLTQQVAHSNLIPGLYTLGALFTVDTLRQALAGAPLLEQLLLLFEAATGMALLKWWLAHKELQILNGKQNSTPKLQTLQTGGWLAMFGLAVGFLAGALGFLRLARLLVSGLLVAGFLALVLYTVLRVLSGWVAFALQVWPLRSLRMVQHHREFLAHRTHRVLIWAGLVAWLLRSLDYVGLLEPAQALAIAIFSAKLEYGKLSLSPGDVLAFALTVWASYLLSAFIRFVLQEDVFPRTRVSSGLSYAVSNLLHYLILTLGFVMGLAALGMDLNKVTVLAGAFGVGIGFGLQSVVNNFVSGLILLFERPLHVGDTIEVGNLLGEVRRIGIRASVVRTRQGADIIVPNAQLVTERLTNWTLSDRMRRIDLPVGVNYGAAPRRVIELLEALARAHPHVLRRPAPQALLTGYGDSSINFELRAWTDQFDDWSTIRSDLAVALYDAVQEAGMQFPFPQREVRVLHDPEPGSAAIPAPGAAPPALPDGGAEG